MEPCQKEEIDRINKMSHEEMARLYRNAPSGHPYFDSTLPYAKVFNKRFFDELGGMTPELSKYIKW